MMTEVVAALIWQRDRFLVCQRPAHKARGFLWEFVGGKVEPGETPREALVRECREELDVTVSAGDIFMELIHEYPDLTVHLTLFHASIVSGTPKLLEHQDLRWITTSQIEELAFCPADETILAALKQLCGSLQARLYALRDAGYHAFQSKLMPTVPSEKVMGVRIPVLRKLVKSMTHSEKETLLQCLPHRYYEEDILHGLCVNEIADFDAAIAALNTFLPYVDNWAVCDLLRPKAFAGRPAGLFPAIKNWISSNHSYTVRFAMGMLMHYYLEDGFSAEHLALVGNTHSDNYYVNMMMAWYFATALAKQYSYAVKWIEERKLPLWVHNKTIQKAVESFRISGGTKTYLKSLRYKGDKHDL